MVANITNLYTYICLFFQESHAIGKRPDNPTDLIEEGELLLTVNIFYPVIFQKVGTKFSRCILIPFPYSDNILLSQAVKISESTEGVW